MSPPRIAITMGDPAGIGPEIILKAIVQLRDRLLTRSIDHAPYKYLCGYLESLH
jgi:4-hydroxy-L-threonine phosphate dehydrogenase PdxA